MRNVALDLGRRIHFAEAAGGKIVRRTVVDDLAELQPILGTEPVRVAIESGRTAWHVHDTLKRWGHEVAVIDTTRARQMGIGHHRRKNDWIDADTMAVALEADRIPKAHVLSPARRRLRELLTVRKHLTSTRASFCAEVRGLLCARGVKVPGCAVEHLAATVRKTVSQGAVLDTVAPLLTIIEGVDAQMLDVEARLELLAAEEPAVTQLKTVPGVGTVVATAFVSVIDDPKRFTSAHKVEAYLGLVPSENTSGKRRLGGITKQGNSYLRTLLVQAAWSILRTRGANPLKSWAQTIARRRTKKNIAAVALARRLAGVLWAMWWDGTTFDPERLGKATAVGLEQQAEATLAAAAAIKRAAQLKAAANKTPKIVRERAAALRAARSVS